MQVLRIEGARLVTLSTVGSFEVRGGLLVRGSSTVTSSTHYDLPLDPHTAKEIGHLLGENVTVTITVEPSERQPPAPEAAR